MNNFLPAFTVIVQLWVKNMEAWIKSVQSTVFWEVVLL